jgi:hypothetical protein
LTVRRAINNEIHRQKHPKKERVEDHENRLMNYDYPWLRVKQRLDAFYGVEWHLFLDYGAITQQNNVAFRHSTIKLGSGIS